MDVVDMLAGFGDPNELLVVEGPAVCGRLVPLGDLTEGTGAVRVPTDADATAGPG